MLRHLNLHHDLRRMNKSVIINKKLWHVENSYGDAEKDMGKMEMTSGVKRRSRKSIRGRLLVLHTDDQIEIAKLLTAWFCSIDISLLQLNQKRSIRLYCRRMRNYSPVDTSARWWVRSLDSDKLGSQPEGQPAFLPVARRETRLLSLSGRHSVCLSAWLQSKTLNSNNVLLWSLHMLLS